MHFFRKFLADQEQEKGGNKISCEQMKYFHWRKFQTGLEQECERMINAKQILGISKNKRDAEILQK